MSLKNLGKSCIFATFVLGKAILIDHVKIFGVIENCAYRRDLKDSKLDCSLEAKLAPKCGSWGQTNAKQALEMFEF